MADLRSPTSQLTTAIRRSSMTLSGPSTQLSVCLADCAPADLPRLVRAHARSPTGATGELRHGDLFIASLRATSMHQRSFDGQSVGRSPQTGRVERSSVDKPAVNWVAAMSTSSARVRIGSFELDLRSGELRSLTPDGPAVKVLLKEQPFQVLRVLVDRAG